MEGKLMARKAIVNKDIILSMLKEGETTQRIAGKFNVSRQAIDLYRKDFIEKGLLPNQRAVRTRKAPKEAAPQKQKIISPRQSPPSKNIVSLDKQIDLIINAFNALPRGTYENLRNQNIIHQECVRCGISLEDFQNDSDVIVLPCRHAFMEAQIRRWIITDLHTTCPTCRAHVNNANANQT